VEDVLWGMEGTNEGGYSSRFGFEIASYLSDESDSSVIRVGENVVSGARPRVLG